MDVILVAFYFNWSFTLQNIIYYYALEVELNQPLKNLIRLQLLIKLQ